MRSTGQVRDALREARGALYIGEGQSRRLASSVDEWQAVRQALDAQIKGLPAGSPIEARIVALRDQIDEALKRGPMFRMADETYRRLSEPLRPFTPEYGPRVAAALERGPFDGPYVQPSGVVPGAFINRGAAGIDELLAAAGSNTLVKRAVTGRLMDDFKSTILTSADNPLGDKVLSAAAADRWWRGHKDVAAKVMTPDQVRVMDTLIEDFAVGARRPTGVAGSPTMQNLSTGNMLNAILRFPMLANSTTARAIMWPLQKLYTLPEERIQAIMMEVMLDPKAAALLMREASQKNAALLAPFVREAIQGAAAADAQAIAGPRNLATRQAGR